jgi:hydrogenase expression/formation protein HypC
MCLGIPGKIVELYESNGLHMCKVDFGGVIKEACIETLPEAKVGDYTIVHVGFGLSILSEEEAKATLDILQEISDLDSEPDSLRD